MDPVSLWMLVIDKISTDNFFADERPYKALLHNVSNVFDFIKYLRSHLIFLA
jgi:hypothetical protein